MTGLIVASGLGCLAAPGNSLDAAHQSMLAGLRSPGASRRLNLDLERELPVFEIESDLLDELDRHAFDGRGWFRTTRLTVLAALEALNQAGLEPAALQPLRVGVCLGTTVGCTLNDEPFYAALRGGQRPEPAPALRYQANNPALHLSRLFQLDGPVATIANACSSGTDAIGRAAAWLREGRCDLALAGGSDELSRVTCLGFSSLMITSGAACRPFDRRRDGLNLGEGAGVLVLETEAGRERRRAPAPQGLVLGYGCSADGYHTTAPHPEGKGLRRAIRKALDEARIDASAIGLVNAHGTSTRDNDQVEGRVLADLFEDAVPVVSTKAYTGHTLGAAGALEAIFTLRQLRDGEVPATAGFAEPDPECRILPTVSRTTVRAEWALSNSLAFGGNNSALVLRRA